MCNSLFFYNVLFSNTLCKNILYPISHIFILYMFHSNEYCAVLSGTRLELCAWQQFPVNLLQISGILNEKPQTEFHLLFFELLYGFWRYVMEIFIFFFWPDAGFYWNMIWIFLNILGHGNKMALWIIWFSYFYIINSLLNSVLLI